MAIQTASGPGIADGPSGAVTMKEPVETTSDDYVSRPVMMDRQGSVSAVKGPGQLEKEVL